MNSISNDIVTLINSEIAWNYKIVPIEKFENQLRILVQKDGNYQDKLRELSVLLNYKIIPEFAEESELILLLRKYYRRNENSTDYKLSNASDTEFLINLIQEAKSLNSSDIHLEIYEERCRIRLRIDGRLIERHVLDKENYFSIVNKIKIQANLDITEKRLPQDGRIKIESEQGKMDLRVSTLPGYYGEKVVVRILGSDASFLNIKDLGFTNDQLRKYSQNINKSRGIILVSGPTGSGKTTTLYASLKELNTPDRNILTIEDPIEYTLQGINQTQLKDSIGYGFASALRTFLRQDPDIIMVGEIRDEETAQIAIRSALTGHLVLSTIHTNDAIGIITRLIDLGIPEFLISSTVNLAIAQRLVRKLCTHCKKRTDEKNEQFIPCGCPECHYTGYSGRLAIYEIIEVNATLVQAVSQGMDSLGVSTLFNVDNLKTQAETLLKQGITSYEEICTIVDF